MDDVQDLSAKYVVPLGEADRRKEGESSRRIGIFTKGSLSQLSDWDNIVAAGGACSLPYL